MTSFTSSKIVLIIIYLYKGRFILSERILQKKTEMLDSKLPLTNHRFVVGVATNQMTAF